MYFKQFYVGCLAHASYMIGDGGEAVVVDPSRDVEMYLDEAKKQGLTIKWVLETHLHADFVSGHRELAERTGATVAIGELAEAQYEHRGLKDGDEIQIGNVVIRAMHTPGHTPESISYLVFENPGDEKPWGVLTGDTLFVGDVGRVDILSSRLSVNDLAGMMFDSVQKLMRLPDDVRVYPAHGAGSLCGRSISSETWSTIGKERQMNPALRITDRDAFIADITRDLPETPVYFLHSRDLNQAGPGSLENAEMPPTIAAKDAAKEVEKGAVLLDTRPSDEFGRMHAKGALNIGLDGQYASWVGTLVKPDDAIVLVTPEGREEEAVMRLARVGYEKVVGIVEGGADGWKAAGLPTAAIPQELSHKAIPSGRKVLDVRRPGEIETAGIKDAVHIPLAQLPEKLATLDKNADWVVLCASGYRSSTATSLMERAGFKSVVNAAGGIDLYKNAGLPVETGA